MTPSTTLTAAREAERAAHEAAAAATKHREQVEKEEQDGGWFQLEPKDSGDVEIRRLRDGTWLWRQHGRVQPHPHYMTDETARGLASLLPRKPVAISDEMVNKARKAYIDRYYPFDIEVNPECSGTAMRAALSAVASDLAPAAAATLGEPAGYVVMCKNAYHVFAAFSRDERKEAFDLARRHNLEAPALGPHGVYALRPVVPDDTEAQG